MRTNNVTRGDGWCMDKFSLPLGPWVFEPKWPSTLVTVLIFPFLVYLGFWQLNRMTEKKHLKTNFEKQLNSSSKSLKELNALNTANKDPSKDLRFYKIKATGQFLNTHQLLLDNQVSGGQSGYLVITPFIPEDDNKILLVNRGWIPIGEDRNKIPQIFAIEPPVTLEGILNKPSQPLRLFNFNSNHKLENPIYPLVLQSIDFKSLSNLMKNDILPYIINLQSSASILPTNITNSKEISTESNNESNSLSNPSSVFSSPYTYKILPLTFGVSSDRHLGYALQWFTMAFIALCYYVVINFHKKGTPQ